MVEGRVKVCLLNWRRFDSKTYLNFHLLPPELLEGGVGEGREETEAAAVYGLGMILYHVGGVGWGGG
jgi:hypothetical protein